MALTQRNLLLCAALVLALASAAAADDEDHVLFIWASAHNGGVANTLWVTDARVLNPDAVESVEVRLAFLPPGADNSAVTEEQVTVQMCQVRRFGDPPFRTGTGHGSMRDTATPPRVAAAKNTECRNLAHFLRPVGCRRVEPVVAGRGRVLRHAGICLWCCGGRRLCLRCG